MSDIYNQALQYEQEGDYAPALKPFYCLLKSGNNTIDRGDLLFHCGWYLEHSSEQNPQQIISCYQQAAECASNSICRMNSAFRAGWILMHNKEYRLAEEWFLKAINIHETISPHKEIYGNACYWLAVILENQRYYLRALSWHWKVQEQFPEQGPESRIRELYCLMRIGEYSAALNVCKAFEFEPPPGFDRSRYQELQEIARRERLSLERFPHAKIFLEVWRKEI